MRCGTLVYELKSIPTISFLVPYLEPSDDKRYGRTIKGFSSWLISILSARSTLAAFLRAVTAAFNLSAYSHPAGERSESALYECSINDCPDYHQLLL
jgi:hypothetical protein